MFNTDIKTNIYSLNLKLGSYEFKKLSDLIMNVSGIKMPNSKRTMLESRLQKRLRKLDMSSYEEYCTFLFSDDGMQHEFVHMMNAVTTNKTDFFREPEHFTFLVKNILPNILNGKQYKREFIIWSAACSTGEEPYTLAIVLEEYKEINNRFNYKILGTDLNSSVIEISKKAIYDESKIKPIQNDMKRKYFLRSKNMDSNKVKVISKLRNNVIFHKLNLLDKTFGIPKKIDVIFCRNVFIYFEKNIQEAIINKFYNYLTPNGLLFMGHSESLNGLDVRFELVAPTIYRKIK